MTTIVKTNKAGVAQLSMEIIEATYGIAVRGAELARNKVPVDTGVLRNSIIATRTPNGGTYGSQESYAGFVEYRTPYLRPSLDEALLDFKKK